ncbi:MAG: carboxymuconolactone decarboxylase family protein [Megasphaera sp.]|jgi:4-carboxymuconolactone decarboxylase|nr:carboxymuconolactone decarboxylase family protein [Megasphaera sp.]
MQLSLIRTSLFNMGGGSFAQIFSGDTMDSNSRTSVVNKNHATMMGKQGLGIEKTDPELTAIMKKYVYGDIVQQVKIAIKEQHLVTLAVLVTNQDTVLFQRSVQGAIQDRVTPLEIRESVYQLAPYVGFSKVVETIPVMDQVFQKNGIVLPLDKQSTINDGNRFDKGLHKIKL